MSKKNDMKAVVFDMDGVLFDTERLCMEGWRRVAAKWDIYGIEEVSQRCIGLNAKDTEALVLDVYGKDFPYGDFRDEISRWFQSCIAKKGLPMKPGVEKLLGYLKRSGYLIGLASSTRYESVVRHLKQAEIIDDFQVLVTGDMIEHSKPLPDIYLLACKKLGVEPGESYAIEDSPNGIRSAHAAGMKAIMVPDLIEPDREMQELSHIICKDLLEVLAYLNC